MTIILFLIDTSASMCQRAYVNGVQKTYLDIAKGAVETFLKYRQRSQDCMGDRYMLLTFEDPPSNVKAGWKENHATFMNELKNLQSTGLTSMGEALKNAFDLLNLNRMQSGIDTYGQGRCPFYLEPSVIIVITDGGRYSFKNGIHQDLTLPFNQFTGMKLTKEPFRWDQRLFSLVLRMPGNKVDERVEGKVPHDDSPIEKMCEVTGGRSYRIKSHFVLNQCIESLVQKVQPGVVVQFEQMPAKDLKDGEIQDITFPNTKKMIYVTKHPTQKNQFPVGFWPIPEPYWPDPKAPNLPPRDAHPKLRIVTPCVDEPQMVRNFPFDKYEVEASPLTLQILSKRESNKCWPVVVSNGNYNQEQPFGYLKASPPYAQVFLIILPYNYPVLLPLVTELLHKYNSTPPTDWIYKFSSYFRQVPQYYGPFLRRALSTASVPYNFLQYILPENLDSYLSQNVATYLKTMKNTAKQEQENMCLRVFKQLKVAKPPYHQVETVKLNCGPLKRELVTHPQLRDTFSKMHGEVVPFENHVIVVPTVLQTSSAKNFRNPFDVPRNDLIDEIARMRDNFFKVPTTAITVCSKDAGHCLPISEMGNYQEFLKNKETPLREIEPTNVRQHMFGNPYKKDKHMVMVDEADLGDVAPMKQHPHTPIKKVPEPGSRPRKRKPGPIRKDYVFRRTSTDSINSSDSGSSGSSMYDSDADDAGSDTSSIRSDNDADNDLIIDFEFNDPSPIEEEFNMNGHVKNFIEMDPAEDVCEPMTPPPPPATSMTPPPSPHVIPVAATQVAVPGHPVAMMAPPLGMTMSTPANVFMPTHFTPQPVTISSLAQTPIVMQPSAPVTPPHNGPPAPTITAPPPIVVAQHTPPATPAPAPQPLIIPHHNDLNDATEISKILQQCHNGSSGSNGNSSSLLDTTHTTHKSHRHTTSLTTTPTAAVVTVNNKDEDNHKMDVDDDVMVSLFTPSTQHNSNHFIPHHNNDTAIANSIGSGVGAILTPAAIPVADAHIKRESADTNDNQEEIVDDDEHKENIKQNNLNARKIIFQDIRRPGRDYSLLLDHLNLIEGNLETKLQFIQMCIEESQRFRRKKMADCIQEWWDKYTEGISFGT